MPAASPHTSAAKAHLVMRLRMVREDFILLGPGKVELMKHIDESGSISEAARRMGMSYHRAWLHVKILNSAFHEPLVLALRGGATGGSASVSSAGKQVIAIYDRMVRAADEAAQDAGRRLEALLKR